TLSVLTALVFWGTSRFWIFRDRFPDARHAIELDLVEMGFFSALDSPFLRGIAALFLLALAGHFALDRFNLLYDDHRFMVGVDYVSETYTLPLIWISVAA